MAGVSMHDEHASAGPKPMAKVLTVSDGVVAGTREDQSGAALVGALEAGGFEVVDRRVVADGTDRWPAR